MKNPKWSWRDFWYGFVGALLVLVLVMICLWGMRLAEKNTKAIGFAQSMAFCFVLTKSTPCFTGGKKIASSEE